MLPTTTTPTIRGLPRPLARALEAHADRLDVTMIRTAYDLAVDTHAGQLRASGEEYVQHTIEVATILAQLRLDTATIIAGLIHDTVEDTEVSIWELEDLALEISGSRRAPRSITWVENMCPGVA